MARFTSKTVKKAGRKGGLTRAQQVNMRDLGRKGGQALVALRGIKHMREIGRRGGAASRSHRVK